MADHQLWWLSEKWQTGFGAPGKVESKVVKNDRW